MTERKKSERGAKSRSTNLKQELLFADLISSIGAFEFDLASKRWIWTPQVAALFGIDPHDAPADFEKCLRNVFPDDALKIPGCP